MNKTQLTQAIEHRTTEVEGYQVNIDNYTRMVAKITRTWCARSEPFRGMDTKAVIAARVDDDLLEKVSDLNFRDTLNAALRAERMEQRKAKLVLEVLQDQLKEIT